MTPSQKQLMTDTLFRIGLPLVTLGIAWGVMTAAVQNKVERAEYQAHVVSVAATDTAIIRMVGDLAGGLCVNEKNPYKRLQWKCDQRGIK